MKVLRIRTAAIFVLLSQTLPGQVCRLSVTGLNQARKVFGPVHAECQDASGILHTAPFGNWGVSSNYGPKRNDHQFDGWCHNTRICDNDGNCRDNCSDGWYEWNSCTDAAKYKAPNCTLYNSGGCTEQETTTGVNVLGNKTVDVPVRCPIDTNGDGNPDDGGCKDVKRYASGTNFMTLYELDPVCCDDLVQSVYFPETVVAMNCDVFGCAPTMSAWVKPSFYDSPTSPGKVSAELGTLVEWGAFVDERQACRIATTALTPVSAASFVGPAVAPESIVTVFGDGLASATMSGSSPLPTSLSGTSVRVIDASGFTRLAPLYYISPGQISFQTPLGMLRGAGTVSVYRGDVLRASGRVQIDAVAPGVFTADSSGKGAPAAYTITARPDGTRQTQSTLFPIDLGPTGGETYLVLFATGIRNVPLRSDVSVTFNGMHGVVSYAGAQGEFQGLDQVNVKMPEELRGAGVVDVVLAVAGKTANAVRVTIR